jgi:hypothetical protein
LEQQADQERRLADLAELNGSAVRDRLHRFQRDEGDRLNARKRKSRYASALRCCTGREHARAHAGEKKTDRERTDDRREA